MGDMFEQAEKEAVEQKPQKPPTNQQPKKKVELLSFDIGKWTGKTPKTLLYEYCRLFSSAKFLLRNTYFSNFCKLKKVNYFKF